MSRLFVLITVCSVAVSVLAADPPPSQAERFLHDGRFADGETALLLALDANPSNDEARFGLGAIQFVRAVENLGRALHEYGAVSENAALPLLRLPVPMHERPSAISHKALGQVLDAFATELDRAESTLAGVKGDDVKLKLRLSNVTFDFTGNGKDRTTLLELRTSSNGERPGFQKVSPDIRVHFDRGDVAWLRAYCHLLCAIVEGYRAVDEEAWFDLWARKIFPKVEVVSNEREDSRFHGLRVVDSRRLRRMRLHLVMVCELNRETWTHIRKETDDDHEWLPHPTQSDQFGLPLTDGLIEAWLWMMAQWEALLKGERLFPANHIRQAFPEHEFGQGLNLKNLLDDPPADLSFDYERIKAEGIDAKYLEAERGKPVFDVMAFLALNQRNAALFGFAYVPGSTSP